MNKIELKRQVRLRLEIIGYNPEAGGYFITHDIYEEWALDKIIERAFSNEVGYKNFFNNYRGILCLLVKQAL